MVSIGNLNKQISSYHKVQKNLHEFGESTKKIPKLQAYFSELN